MITLVSGFQRCGSSLMCQMLQAGGLSVFHDPESGYPSFETRRQMETPIDAAWFRSLDGRAVKWLEPSYMAPPIVDDRDVRIVWMRRNPRQQAKSAVKFLRHVGGIAVSASAVGQFAQSYRTGEPIALAILRDRGPVFVQSFEGLIENPQQAARDVAAFLGLDMTLDLGAMVGQVIERPTACLPGFLEEALIARCATA